MKIGIVGATGMLGQHALRAALARGHAAVALYRSPASLAHLAGLPVETRRADLAEEASLAPALEGLDAVINAAAYYPTAPRPWREEVATATRLMGAFYRAAEQAGVGRIVYVGGAIALPRRADGRPADGSERYDGPPADRNPYLQVKWALDELALAEAARGRPVSIGIPSMTFGEHDHGPTTGQLIVGIASGRIRSYVRGRRNVVYAGDAGRGLVQVAERGLPGQRYLLTGSNSSMDEVAQLVARLAGVAPPRPAPLAAARLVAALQRTRYRWLRGPLPTISETAIAVMASGQHLDGARTAAALGYAPELDLEQTLSRTLAWFRAQNMT